jgi:hypothetical protein
MPERAPILTPLATELIPLGTSLQTPPTEPFHLPLFVGPARLVLGLLPSAVLAPNPDGDGRFQAITSPGFRDFVAIDSPHGRSPPSE